MPLEFFVFGVSHSCFSFPLGNRPPKALPIPAAYITVGHRFSFNIASFFIDDDNDALYYTAEGLSVGTGIRINERTGEVYGVPTLSDLEKIMPIQIAIWANDGREGKARGMLYLTVRAANSDPTAKPIPDGTISKGTGFSAKLGEYFMDADENVLAFYLEGAPLGTGLSLDRKTGVLSGEPSESDLRVGTLVMAIIADDGHGGAVRNSFKLTVIAGSVSLFSG